MANQKFDLQLFYDKTNGGLSYIHEVYPQSVGCEDKSSKKFKIRVTEKSASTTLWRGSDNIYRVKDHGGDKAQNAIDLCMQEENLNFPQACEFLFSKYGLAENTPTILKPEVTFKESDQPAGSYDVNWITPTNLSVFAPFLTTETAAEYNLFEISSYEKVTKTKKIKIVTATDRYPIFGYKEDGFVKVYEPNCPKNDEYLLKHHFLGTKPARHVYGWSRLFKNVEFDRIVHLRELIQEAKRTGERVRGLEDELDELLYDSVIIATGGSDGLNLASLGYNVIWFNSESEQITSDEYYRLSLISKVVYNLGDLDATGVRQSVAVGMKFVDIKNIWLPENVNGSKLKDVRDWVSKHKNFELDKVQNLFKKILSNALEFRFWKWNSKRSAYTLDNKILLYFLKHSGFYLYKILQTTADSTKEIEDTRLIQITDNIVRVVSPRSIKNYVLQWLDDRFVDRAVYNMIIKSVYFSDNALLLLPEITLATDSATKDSQMYFFQNKVVKITADTIAAFSYKEVNTLVWESNIVKHDFKAANPFFAMAKDESNNFKIDIFDKSSNFFKVLIQTSRMYWRKDADNRGRDTKQFEITSANLTAEENAEQVLHLLNKMYITGYLLHKYKMKSRPWFVLGIDKKIGASIKDSNGGSGKSFLIESTQYLLKNIKFKDGKEMPKEDPKFMFDGVTAETDMVFMDDMVQNQDYNVVFSKTSGVFVANHKGGKIFTIPYDQSPKITGTTNYVPNDLSAALMRRLLAYQCSDYYHQESKEYAETRKISTDFNNRDLFDKDYPKADWNADFNFMLQCVQLYLSQPDMIKAPSESLVIRNLQQKIGDVMLKHCNEWFDEKDESGNYLYRDTWFPRKDMQDDYVSEAGKYAKTSTAHKDNLEDYCAMRGWTFTSKKLPYINPISGKRGSIENYFFNTSSTTPTPEITETQHFADFDDDDTEDIPTSSF